MPPGDRESWRCSGRRATGPWCACFSVTPGPALTANTEVLAYVEGFTTDFHRRPAIAAEAGPAFFELLGAFETRKLFSWAQADPAVQVEALTRLREYHATPGIDHQRLWKQWLDKELGESRRRQDRTQGLSHSADGLCELNRAGQPAEAHSRCGTFFRPRRSLAGDELFPAQP